jgi:hypothetical protein
MQALSLAFYNIIFCENKNKPGVVFHQISYFIAFYKQAIAHTIQEQQAQH